MQAAVKVQKRTATASNGQVVGVLSFTGDISASSKDTVLEAYHSFDSSVKHVLLDFTHVDYINSSGIAIIIQLLLEASRNGGRDIGIFGLSSHFHKVFTMVGVAKYAKIANDEVEAMTAIS